MGKQKKVSRRIALPKMFSSQEEAIPAIKKELQKEGWYTEKLNITLNRYDYSLPSKTELLPKLNAWSDQQVLALVRDERGALPEEMPSASDFAQQAENIALMSSMKQCQKFGRIDFRADFRDSRYPKDISSPEQWYRYSGSCCWRRYRANRYHSIRVNDTGAFGKCAPTSYYCGVICGIAKGCQDGFNALKDDDDTRELALSLRSYTPRFLSKKKM